MRRLARLRDRLRERGLRLMLDFVPNHTGLDHPWVEEPSRILRLGNRRRSGSGRRRTTPGSANNGRRSDPGSRARSVLSGWPDTLQLDYSNPATQEAMLGELLEDRRPMRRRPLRHGHARAARCLRAHLGPSAAAVLAASDAARSTSTSRDSVSWPRSTGISNGRCSNRASITPTTNGSTTASARGMPGRFVNTSTPGSTTRTSWRGFSRITTSHERPRRSLPTCTGGRGHHVSLAGAAVLPPGTIRGTQEAHLAAPGSRAARAADDALQQFYDRLLSVLRHAGLREGHWQLLECAPAWDGNWTWDGFLAFAWQGPGGRAACS